MFVCFLRQRQMRSARKNVLEIEGEGYSKIYYVRKKKTKGCARNLEPGGPPGRTGVPRCVQVRITPGCRAASHRCHRTLTSSVGTARQADRSITRNPRLLRVATTNPRDCASPTINTHIDRRAHTHNSVAKFSRIEWSAS